jgi:hypothetical protein
VPALLPEQSQLPARQMTCRGGDHVSDHHQQQVLLVIWIPGMHLSEGAESPAKEYMSVPVGCDRLHIPERGEATVWCLQLDTQCLVACRQEVHQCFSLC